MRRKEHLYKKGQKGKMKIPRPRTTYSGSQAGDNYSTEMIKFNWAAYEWNYSFYLAKCSFANS